MSMFQEDNHQTAYSNVLYFFSEGETGWSSEERNKFFIKRKLLQATPAENLPSIFTQKQRKEDMYHSIIYHFKYRFCTVRKVFTKL